MAGTALENGGASGSTKFVKMAIKTVDVKLDEIGYVGWVVTFRTNPRAEYYDMFLSSDEKIAWEGFKHFVLAWNLADEDGNATPLPKDGLEQNQLPYDVQNYLIQKYVEAFNLAASVPKGPQANSNGTSPTREDHLVLVNKE